MLTTGGGLSGAFATLSGIPAFVTGQLSYDANNAYLTLSPVALAPSLSNGTGNQHRVLAAIDAAVHAGAAPNGGFLALYGLTGAALSNALDQISGQVGPNVTNAVGNSFLSFLSMTAQGGSGSTGNFAPGDTYGGADAPHRAQLGSGETRMYGRATVDAAYIAASFGYGWHQVKTVRTVTVSGTDVLQGKQNANDFGGRIETGWHVALSDGYGVIPYGAFAGESFDSPAYAETSISGASTFALSYGAQTTALGRTELGAHLNRDYALDTGT
ncbi:MAG: autotransporter outer membrane beta-barrel domain-containing protein, partial [Bradyrhizobium sp.]|nr:autotransporter outer membrane beta-barrel domain-containing protein [Bradyrhizobium sp.]